MSSRLYRIAGTLGGWALVITTLIMSGRILYRTVGIALSSRFQTPYSDQWDQIPVIKAYLDGTASIAGFWAQHNEHRIPLFRLLDAIDGRYFHGTGQALLLVNWAMVLATVTLLSLLAWRLPGVRWRDKTLGTALIVAGASSSAQIENLAFPIGSTNLGVYLFGVATFAGIAYAGRPGGSRWRWILPAIMAFLGTSSLVSGLLIWPIAWVMALVIGVSWRGLLGWAVLSGLVIGLYLNGYFSIGTPGVSARQMSAVIDFILLYFGNPLGAMGMAKSAVARMVALSLFVGALYALQVRRLLQHRAVAALAATGIFIGGTGLLTTTGRLTLGTAAALASRYTTPVLIFWSVSLLLLLAVPVARTMAWAPVRALRVMLPALAVLCLMRVEPFGEWIIPTAFGIRQTGVGVALGISDPPHEVLGGVTAERVSWYRPTLLDHGLSMFYVAHQLGLSSKLADHYAIAPPQDCFGSVDEINPVLSPKDAAWIHGWVWDRDGRRLPTMSSSPTALGRSSVGERRALPGPTSRTYTRRRRARDPVLAVTRSWRRVNRSPLTRWTRSTAASAGSNPTARPRPTLPTPTERCSAARRG